MDRVHNIDKKPWISQKKCNIKELTRERHSLLNEHQVSLRTPEQDNEDDEEYLDLSDKLVAFVRENQKEVESCFMFNQTDEKFLTNEPRCKLKMYELQLEHAKQMITDRQYKVSYLARLKTTRKETLMRHLASMNLQKSAQKIINTGLATTSGDTSTQQQLIDINALTVILVIQMWPQPNKAEKFQLEKEIYFRSDQCLTELRDYFKCQRDYGVPMDLSDNPEQQDERVFRGELFKSGFFLIEDTFYNDLRDINNIDLSARILEWANSEVTTVGEDGRNIKVARGIGPFKRAKMEETRLEDLTIRLGCPYLYYHQGNCEHLFTISDIRYVPRTCSSLKTIQFPYVTAMAMNRKEDQLRCYMCRTRPPHWYTRNNNRLPVDPFFFCENCFLTFNYNSDKKKIGQFQAYLYTGSAGIPDSIVMMVNK